MGRKWKPVLIKVDMCLNLYMKWSRAAFDVIKVPWGPRLDDSDNIVLVRLMSMSFNYMAELGAQKYCRSPSIDHSEDELFVIYHPFSIGK